MWLCPPTHTLTCTDTHIYWLFLTFSFTTPLTPSSSVLLLINIKCFLLPRTTFMVWRDGGMVIWEMRHNYLQSSIPNVQVYETSCCVSGQPDLFAPTRRGSCARVVGMAREGLSQLKSSVGIDASKNVEGSCLFSPGLHQMDYCAATENLHFSD